MEEIRSLKDIRVQTARKLNSLKERIDAGKFLITGIEAIEWAIDAEIEIEFILTSRKDFSCSKPDIPSYLTSEGLMKKVTSTAYLIPVVAVGKQPVSCNNSDFIIVMDKLQDYGNIGTIVRTAHAFGIKSVIFTNREKDLFHKKSVDASRGRVFSTGSVSFDSPSDTLRYLKKKNYQIITTSPYGNSLQSLAELDDRPIALITGNETSGADPLLIDNADITVQIPMHSCVESLNAGVATGISIYELKLKQVIGMIDKKIKSTLGREINVAGMLIKQVLGKELSKVSSLASSQLIFMMVLKCDTEMQKKDIQNQFGITDAEYSNFITPLESRNLIKKEADKITICEKGVDTIGKLWSIVENSESMILDALTQEESKTLLTLLSKLQSSCVRILNS